MAGTTVDEGGLVYKSLRNAMNAHGLNVTLEDMNPWHGAHKTEVITHFVNSRGRSDGDVLIPAVEKEFQKIASEAYFGKGSSLALIHPDLFTYFGKLQRQGIKIGLNTGYPRVIQDGLLDALKFRAHVDAHISSQEVPYGRPSPYMVFRLMEQTNVQDVRKVAKVGDSVNDILEGRNAGCGLVVGVLSGADSAEDLMKAGADFVVGNVTDIKIE